MTQNPLDHDRGASKERLKQFTEIEREAVDAKEGPAQKPLDHAHGESKGRLKQFTEIEREAATGEAAKEMGKHREYDPKSRRLAEYLRIDRGRTE